MIVIKYFAWFFLVIIWNYGFPNVSPILDIIIAILLRHIFDIFKFFNKLLFFIFFNISRYKEK